jgi:hypothetical protein
MHDQIWDLCAPKVQYASNGLMAIVQVYSMNCGNDNSHAFDSVVFIETRLSHGQIILSYGTQPKYST